MVEGDCPIPVYRLMTEKSTKFDVGDSTLLDGLRGIVIASGVGIIATAAMKLSLSNRCRRKGHNLWRRAVNQYLRLHRCHASHFGLYLFLRIRFYPSHKGV
jgi:hypothetical protein